MMTSQVNEKNQMASAVMPRRTKIAWSVRNQNTSPERRRRRPHHQDRHQARGHRGPATRTVRLAGTVAGWSAGRRTDVRRTEWKGERRGGQG
jgi:hypothetical protein